MAKSSINCPPVRQFNVAFAGNAVDREYRSVIETVFSVFGFAASGQADLVARAIVPGRYTE